MTDELLRRFRELDPVPDPDRFVDFGGVDLPADPVLRAVLEQARATDRRGPTGAPATATREHEEGDPMRMSSPVQSPAPSGEDQRTGRGRPRRGWLLAAAAGAVVALMLAALLMLPGTQSEGELEPAGGGDTTETDETTATDEGTAADEAAPDPTAAGPVDASALNGVWLLVTDVPGRGQLAAFNHDGSFAIDDGGHLATRPAAQGGYEVEEGSVSFTSDGSVACPDGTTWAWQATRVEDGRLHVVHTEEGVGNCRVETGTEWTYVRLSPGSAVSGQLRREIRDRFDAAEGRPPTENDLAGVWMGASWDGMLAWFDGDGSFAVDDSGRLLTRPAGKAAYELDDDGTMRFTSEGSAVCPDGTTWGWQVTHLEDGLLHVLHTEEATAGGSCRVEAGTEWIFVRVSPSPTLLAEILDDVIGSENPDD